MKDKILAVIPARGGSKRLPRKNILPLNGKPMITYSIESALSSRYIDKVVVSSDDDEILSISKEYGVDTIKRSKELSSDTATTFDTVEDVLRRYEEYKYVILLQPTSPLRTKENIDESIELLRSKSCSAIISVSEMEHSPLWSNTLSKDNSMVGFLSEELLNTRSQDLDTYYRINGAIYICRIDRFLEEKGFFIKDDIYAYKMDRYNSIDIDEKIDFMIADLFLKEKNKGNK